MVGKHSFKMEISLFLVAFTPTNPDNARFQIVQEGSMSRSLPNLVFN